MFLLRMKMGEFANPALPTRTLGVEGAAAEIPTRERGQGRGNCERISVTAVAGQHFYPAREECTGRPCVTQLHADHRRRHQRDALPLLHG